MPSEDSKPVKKEELEDEDEDDMCLSSILRDKNKKKPASIANAAASKLPKSKKEETPDAKGNSSQKKPISKPVKVKKVEPDTSDSDDDKPIAMKPVPKDDKPIAKKPAPKDDKSKTKNKKKEEVKKKIEVEVRKKERKVYALPGQKRDPPEERDSLRIFYESLYEQRPDSEMAAIWMMESGLLSEDVAKKVYEKKQKKSQMQRFGSPMKAVSTTKRVIQSKSATVKKVKDSSCNSANKRNTTTTVTTVKTKKRKKDESSSEEDSEDDFVISKVVKKRKT